MRSLIPVYLAGGGEHDVTKRRAQPYPSTVTHQCQPKSYTEEAILYTFIDSIVVGPGPS